MPIPVLVSEEKLRLVEPTATVAVERPSLHLSARVVAHVLDLSLVFGLSWYAAKVLALGLVAFYAAPIQGVGEGAESLFRELYVYANGQMLAGCFGLFSIFYFVALPAYAGRTLGLGLFGLKIVDAAGNSPSAVAMTRRWFVCVLTYVSGGLLLLTSLRERVSALPQDSLSDTIVTKA